MIKVITGAIFKEFSLLLVKKSGLDFWILPGGKQNAGELFREDSLRREIKEELNADVEEMRYLKTFVDQAAGLDVKVEVNLYRTFLDHKTPPVCSGEIEKMIWYNPEKYDTMDIPLAPSLEKQIIPYFFGR